MGVRALPRIAERLIAGGRGAGRAGRRSSSAARCPGQRTFLATLADVAERAQAEGIRAPAITLVGAGRRAARASSRGSSAGRCTARTVAVTRARAQASALAARLRELGADVVEAPAIRDRAARRASCPTCAPTTSLCVTSPNGAARAVRATCRDARDLAGAARRRDRARGRRAALREHGIEPDVVPERSVAEGLVEALGDGAVDAGADRARREGRDVLPDALRERGAEVDVLVLYETVAEPLETTRAPPCRRRLRAVHVGVDRRRSSRPPGAPRRCATAAAVLDRARHERGAARPRARARPRGGDPHARRTGGRALGAGECLV